MIFSKAQIVKKAKRAKLELVSKLEERIKDGQSRQKKTEADRVIINGLCNDMVLVVDIKTTIYDFMINNLVDKEYDVDESIFQINLLDTLSLANLEKCKFEFELSKEKWLAFYEKIALYLKMDLNYYTMYTALITEKAHLNLVNSFQTFYSNKIYIVRLLAQVEKTIDIYKFTSQLVNPPKLDIAMMSFMEIAYQPFFSKNSTMVAIAHGAPYAGD